MQTRLAVFAATALAGALLGCGGGSQATEPPSVQPAQEPSAPPASWPSELLAGPGAGPAMFLTEEPNGPALGYVSPGVRVQIMGSNHALRIPVRIEGAMTVQGWFAIDRLVARVQRRGRIKGAPVYVGPNDIVRVLGPATRGRMQIEVRPVLTDMLTAGPFVGTFPKIGLGVARLDPEPSMLPKPGAPFRLPAGQQVQLYSNPRTVVATLPATTPPLVVRVLRDRGEWKGVRVGMGPYLLGYVRGPLEAAEAMAPASRDPLAVLPVAADALPDRLQADADKPLWKLPAGTQIRFGDRVIATLNQPGLAREMTRYAQDGEADVFVAVDNTVAVRGMVRVSELQALAPPATPLIPPPP